MSVKKTNSAETLRELRRWWRSAATDLICEYGLDSFQLESRGKAPVRVPVCEDLIFGKRESLSLEMPGGIPAVVLRGADGSAVKAVADPFGCPVGDGLFNDASVRFKPSDEILVLESLKRGWEAARADFGRESDSRFTNTVDGLVARFHQEVVLDEVNVDPYIFYRWTRRFDEAEMGRLRSDVTRLLGDFYKGRFESGLGLDRRTVEVELAFMRKKMDERFSAAYSLMGRLDYRLFNLSSARERQGAGEIFAVADWAKAAPEYAPYLESFVYPWVKDRCHEAGVPLSRVPDRLLGEEDYKKRHPEQGRSPRRPSGNDNLKPSI